MKIKLYKKYLNKTEFDKWQQKNTMKDKPPG